jgi:hypothetical protein
MPEDMFFVEYFPKYVSVLGEVGGIACTRPNNSVLKFDQLVKKGKEREDVDKSRLEACVIRFLNPASTYLREHQCQMSSFRFIL